ncbi:MAG TPA: 2-dehydropantoate 2-reductase [Alphaproteobacteria bacterium]|nr:2-dehydropantoate 2-reductase [Alphaproteobacteria bacterium]
MRFCVIGAGAIGGVLAGRLARAGAEVTAVVRNPAHRDAIAQTGLTLVDPSGAAHVVRNLRAVSVCAEAGPQDAVILALKAHQIAGVCPAIRALFGPKTMVLTLQNGIPWWYFQRHGGRFEGYCLAALDPGGAIGATIEPERVVGAVAYFAGEVLGPGRVRHGGGARLPVGELDGKHTSRAAALAAELVRAGFESPVLDDIRGEIWFKVWANACFNPIGALTHATIDRIASDAQARELLIAMMGEARAVAAKLGVRFRQTAEERIAIVAKVAGHKPSMLQDVEAGKALEIEALAGVLVELGRLTGTPTPRFDAVYACAKLLDKVVADGRVGFLATRNATA